MENSLTIYPFPFAAPSHPHFYSERVAVLANAAQSPTQRGKGGGREDLGEELGDRGGEEEGDVPPDSAGEVRRHRCRR